MFEIRFSLVAQADLLMLKGQPALSKRFQAVNKSLYYLQTNPRHPGLRTHKYTGLKGKNGEEIFEAYAENRTPGAYRIFWHYGPGENEITVIAITPHP